METGDTLEGVEEDANRAADGLASNLAGLRTSVYDAERCGTTRRTIQLWARKGILPFVEVRLPGAPWPTRLFRIEDIDRIAARRRDAGEGGRAA